MENKIPTAEELYYQFKGANINISKKQFVEAVKHSNKLHVKAALGAAANKATVTPIDHEEISEGSFRPIWGVDDDSILNAYPLNLIK